MKRIRAVITAIYIFTYITAMPVMAEKSFGAFRFEQYTDGIVITGFNSVFSDTVVIPSSINGIPVTRINDATYRARCGKWPDVRQVTFPDSLEYVGSLVGACFPNVEKVTLPTSLRRIGDYAFEGTDISEVTIPEGTVEIGAFAFAKTDIAKINIPSTVKKFDNSILYGCPGSAIEISADNKFFKTAGDGIYSSSGDMLLKYTGNAVSFAAPETLKYIGRYSFTGTDIEKVVTGAEPSEYAFAESKIKTAVLSGAHALPPYAFYGCKELGYVSLGESVSSIGAHAFEGCPKEFELDLKGSIYNIDKTALGASFSGTVTAPCDSASEAYTGLFEGARFVAKTSQTPTGIPVALYREVNGKTNIERYLGGESDAVIPPVISGKTVGEIEPWSFSATDIRNVKISAQQIGIGQGAFCGAKLKSIEFVGKLGLIRIGERAFEGSDLTSVKLDGAVGYIGDRAFALAPMTEITIPETVKKIGSRALADCPNLTRVYFEGDAPEIAPDAFDGHNPDLKIYFRNGKSGFDRLTLPKECVPDVAHNGSIIKLKTPSININGTIMLPLKEIFENCGYSVIWNGADGDNGSVTLKKGDQTAKIFMGSTGAIVNGTEKEICAAPTVLSGISRIPSRAAAELLGFKIFWNGTYNTVEFID